MVHAHDLARACAPPALFVCDVWRLHKCTSSVRERLSSHKQACYNSCPRTVGLSMHASLFHVWILFSYMPPVLLHARQIPICANAPSCACACPCMRAKLLAYVTWLCENLFFLAHAGLCVLCSVRTSFYAFALACCVRNMPFFPCGYRLAANCATGIWISRGFLFDVGLHR